MWIKGHNHQTLEAYLIQPYVDFYGPAPGIEKKVERCIELHADLIALLNAKGIISNDEIKLLARASSYSSPIELTDDPDQA